MVRSYIVRQLEQQIRHQMKVDRLEARNQRHEARDGLLPNKGGAFMDILNQIKAKVVKSHNFLAKLAKKKGGACCTNKASSY